MGYGVWAAAILNGDSVTFSGGSVAANACEGFLVCLFLSL